MTITSVGGGNATITVNSPAKNGTLGAQGSIDPDQIVLDTSLTAVNNGTVADPLIGRLLILRRGEPDEETKQITEGADGDTTIRVHEDWDSPPVSGDSYDISYVFGDTISLTGMSLSAKTGVFEATRRLLVGNGTDFGYIALKDQEAFEIRDDATNVSLEINSFGRFDVGFLLGGNAGAGGLMNTLNNVVGEPSVQFNSGSEVNYRDAISFSYRASANMTTNLNGVVSVKNWKNVQLANLAIIAGSGSYEDVSWTGGGNASDSIAIDLTTLIDRWTLTSTDGFRTLDGDTSTETLELRNVIFVNNSRNVWVNSNKTWNVVNPTWTIVTGTQDQLAFATATANEVNEKVSLDLAVQEPDGTAISGAAAYVYEGLLNQDLPVANRMFTEGAGTDSSDILKNRFTSGSSDDLIVTSSGDFTLKSYKYAKQPFLGALNVSGGIDQTVTLLTDTAVSASTAADALTNGSSSITPIQHGPNTTGLDIYPLKVFHYDGGTGTVPSAGQIVSGTTSNSTGSVLEVVFGDNTDAYLVLSGWSGGQFTNNETIGNGVGWEATADTALFDEEYTWEYDCSGFTLQIVYDYDRAKTAEDPALSDTIYRDSIIWGADEQTNMIFSDGTNYFTERNEASEQGVWLSNRGAGTVSYMTADSGSQFVPPTTINFEITGIQLGTEVRMYDADTNLEITGDESMASNTFSYSYVYSGGDIDIYIVIFHLNYKDIRLTGLQLSNTDQSIPIQQITDRVYSNP
jgi:hypothetical protein